MIETPSFGTAPLRTERLTVRYHQRRGRTVDAVRDVSLTVPGGATLAIIGESGSGKSSLIRALCGLTETSSGRIYANNLDLTGIPYRRRAHAAGAAGIGIVFQNPMAALDPRWPAWRSIAEAIPVASGGRTRFVAGRRVKGQRLDQDRDRALRLLGRVGLSADYADRRPTEMSGGQLQRVTIARALAAEPRVLLYDEVVSALDVSVRNEILRLLAEVGRTFHLTSVFISHDMASVVQLATRVAVMYRGQVVETGTAQAIIGQPRDPYTQKLLAAVPQLRISAV